MLEKLKREVCEANLKLVAEGLVIHTWGNVSGVDRASGNLVIKPSGVAYDVMKPRDMVVVSLDSGKVVEGALNPSSDTPTHLVLYRAFKKIGGIVHTHSLYATVWAQANRNIPALGTTHADYFHGSVPVTKPLTPKEIRTDYEINTGHAIVRRFAKLDPLHMPGVLVAGHAPFCWGATPTEAAHAAVVIEEIAALATVTITANPKARAISKHLHDKHFLRKHGSTAYYGQKK